MLLQAEIPPNIKQPYGPFGLPNASQQQALWQIRFIAADKGSNPPVDKTFLNIFAAHADFHTDPLMGLLHNNPELADALSANWCWGQMYHIKETVGTSLYPGLKVFTFLLWFCRQ